MPRGELRIRGLTVGQTPNPPLLAAVVGALVALVADEGSTVHAIGSALFYLAFTIWSWEELAHGMNWFRRLLGVGGLAIVAVMLVATLG